MSAATSKTTKAASAKTTTATTKAKALPATIVKAKKASQPIIKKEYVEPVKPAKSRSAKALNKQKALTKEELEKRQKSKGTNRKQGGKKFSALKQKDLKTLANIPEAGPTQVSS